MLMQHTFERLREMGLHGMAQALDAQRLQTKLKTSRSKTDWVCSSMRSGRCGRIAA